MQRIAVLLDLEQDVDHAPARQQDGREDRREQERADDIESLAPARRREVEEGIDADMRLLPGDRDGGRIDAEIIMYSIASSAHEKAAKKK